MQIAYQDDFITHYCGDAIAVLNSLPEKFVQAVITSPPYWALRKYKGDQDIIWDQGNGCQHEWMVERTARPNAGGGANKEMQSRHGSENFQAFAENGDRATYSNTCSKCGAWKGAYGLEPTIEMYIEHTMQFLDAIRRVLRDDGVVFWNISDCYWTGKGQSGQKTPEQQGQRHDDGRSLNMAAQQLGGHDVTMPRDGKHPVIKSLDMCMIPYRFALVAQERGWYVRADIIWYKNNPMPESINSKRWVKRGDGLVLKTGSWRPTTAHEYIFMLTKTDNYYSDIEAAKEKRRGHTHPRGTKLSPPYESAGIGHENWASYMGNGDSYTTRNPRSVWHINGKPFSMGICGDCGRVYNGSRYRRLPFDASRRKRVCICGSTNWTSHFATFPDDLPQKCILATTSDAGCCSKCGAPVLRIVEVKPSTMNIRVRDARHGVTAEEGYKASDKEKENYGKEELGWTKTVGWKPECDCGASVMPCTVLDPFAGSGTTLMVAKRMGRRSIGIDLADEYTGLIKERCEKITGAFLAGV